VTREPRLVLAALWLAVSAAAGLWVAIDRRPPEWDHANHLERAVDCYRSLRIVSNSGAREILEASSFYPPLATCAAGLLYLVLPVAPLTAQAVMMGFLGLAIVSLYSLGRRLADVETGLWGAFFFVTAPFVVFSLTNFQLDLPLAAMVAAALYALLRAEDFSRRGWSLALGAALGLGMLTKPPFAIYVAPPLLWSLWCALRSQDRRRRLGWAAAALAIGGLLALPWYGPRLFGLPMQVLNRSFKQAAEQQNAEPLTIAALLYYPRTLPTQLGILAALLFLWGLWTLRRNRAARPILWLATLSPFIVFSLIQNKNLRYTLPILPAAALVAAVGLRSLPAMARRWAGAAVVALAALQVSMTLFQMPTPPTLPGMILPMALGRAPSGADWQHDRILADLGRASGGRPVTVAVIPNDNFFSVSNFRYEVVRRGLPYRMTRAWSDAPLGVDFVVLKSRDQGPAYAAARPERLTRAFAGGDPYWISAFPVVGEYPLPDGSTGILRARRVPPLAGATPAVVAARLTRDPERLLAENLREALGLRLALDYGEREILRGSVKHAVLTADAALIGEFNRPRRAPLRVRDVRLEIDGLLLNPHRLMGEDRLEILDIDGLRVSRLTVTEQDLDTFLRGQPVGRGMTVALRDGTGDVLVTGFGPALRARIRFGPADRDRPFTLIVERVSIGGIHMPGFLVDWIMRHFDPTPALRRLPIPVTLAPVRILPGHIEIGEK
jgi:4-amino-4-deoxy-L-arabinose transferase-like glycosyltransferase